MFKESIIQNTDGTFASRHNSFFCISTFPYTIMVSMSAETRVFVNNFNSPAHPPPPNTLHGYMMVTDTGDDSRHGSPAGYHKTGQAAMGPPGGSSCAGSGRRCQKYLHSNYSQAFFSNG